MLERFSLLIPAGVWLLYSWASSPMMYPGFDIWSHLAHMEWTDARSEPWRLFWAGVFDAFDTSDYFEKAQLIHRVQLLLMGCMLFFSARWVLLLALSKTQTLLYLFNLAAWFSLLIWLVMHGTVSTPVFGQNPVWQSWVQWYSVNYQIALPLYVFSASSLMFGLFGREAHSDSYPSWFYLTMGLAAALGVAVIHAAELPYLLLALLAIGLIWFKWSLKWYYLALGITIGFLGYFGLKFSYALPEGLHALRNTGWRGFLQSVAANGHQMVNGLNRGNASWNYWYWATTLAAVAALLISLRFNKLNNNDSKSVNTRVVLFILLSMLPAAMLQFKWTSGLMTMITYPALAWRFTFSSFLFVAPAALFLILCNVFPRWQAAKLFTAMGACFIFLVLVSSKLTETHSVSYQYAKSVVMALSAEKMSFGATPKQKEWVLSVKEGLEKSRVSTPVCTDMFTAYHLFFIHRYENVVLPNRISGIIDPQRTEAGCNFPIEGGAVVKSLGVGPSPWVF